MTNDELKKALEEAERDRIACRIMDACVEIGMENKSPEERELTRKLAKAGNYAWLKP